MYLLAYSLGQLCANGMSSLYSKPLLDEIGMLHINYSHYTNPSSYAETFASKMLQVLNMRFRNQVVLYAYLLGALARNTSKNWQHNVYPLSVIIM